MKVYVVGHMNPDTDSVCSAIVFSYLLNKWKEKDGLIKIDGEAVPVIQGEPNPETKFVLEKFGVEKPEIIEDVEGKTIALVDFSEKAQAPKNIEKAEIIAIVDHHKIGDITTPNPILFVNLPVGCTATVLKKLFDWSGVEIPKELAGLMLASILSDTVIFKSATTTELDKEAAKELAKIAGIENIEEFGIEVKAKLSAVDELSARDIILRDFKDFDMSGNKVGIGQIELVDLKLIEGRKEEILEELKKMKEEGGYHTVALMLTDIIKEGTELLVVTDDASVIEKAFGKKLEGNSVWLEGVMSRKKQVVPPLENAFSS
ncbi:Inorganic diphosphatase [Ferroglobus placidus DSM 10642]|uniref:Probable manganese-dependent inorganic pyrophosphatase n=1 Tax=Ferroglobus placidus (strain DSM 10642 / AEDII12DO) TaxID=589924 RepID=D3RY56_FERPA|nr:manganese-dependent inorganic pyrophosphatase [Ferroglobus placidus]ADC65419.1 Inorganic diphosphatase [Ferroglobus placidus DSM 10642]